jgi:chromosome segregation ATPase
VAGARGGGALDGGLSTTIAALQAAMADAARAQSEAEGAHARDAAAWGVERGALLARVASAEGAAAASGAALGAERATRAAAAASSTSALAARLAEAEDAAAAAAGAAEAREREWTARLAAVKAAAAAEVRDAHATLQAHMNDAAAALSESEEAFAAERARAEAAHARAVAAAAAGARAEADAAAVAAAVADARAEAEAAAAAERAEADARLAAALARCEKLEGDFRALLAEYDTLLEEEKGWTNTLRDKDEEVTKLRGNLAAVSDVLQGNIERVMELEKELALLRAQSPAAELRQAARTGWLGSLSPSSGAKK